MASRGKLVRAPAFDVTTLRTALANCDLDGPALVAGQKDFHLVEAAISTEFLVISLDDRARAVFASASGRVRQFGRICWINPVQRADSIDSWLHGEIDTPRAWNLDPERERR
jgi:hypothetical protein